MRYLLTGTEMKSWEKKMMEKYKVPSILLMERAAASVVKEILKSEYGLHRVLVVCGTGNNGGDGLAVARMLQMKGFSVEVFLLGQCEKLSTDARLQLEMYQAISGKMVTVPNYKEYTVIVDALFGIGCNRNITGEKVAVIEGINESGAFVVSIDVPSGVSSDNGTICGVAVKAHTTVTFFTEKLGIVLYPGRDYCGKILVEDLEIPFEQTKECQRITYEKADLGKLPIRKNDSHKGTYGKVLIIAGSPTISGAAYLSAAAAYKTGAGLVKIFTPKENKVAMQSLLPEALLEIYDRENLNKKQLAEALNWAEVVVIGPGLGTDETAEQILKYVMNESSISLVIDADGINLLAKNPEWMMQSAAEIILTPHVLEMARISGETKEHIKANALEVSNTFTKKYPVTLVLKDARTIVTKNQELVYINTSGNSGMATGGSGDVLAGIIGGLLAQGMNPIDAARLGVYVHGGAGDAACDKKGPYGMLASDILEGITEVTKV